MAGGFLVATTIILNIDSIHIVLSNAILERMALATTALTPHDLYRLLLDILFWLLYVRLINNLDIINIQRERSMVAGKETLRRVEKATETHSTR